jgi:hypothetical protein
VVGDHGGGVNLVRGCSGRPIHGKVAGARGGEVVGEANRFNMRGKRCVVLVVKWRSSRATLI